MPKIKLHSTMHYKFPGKSASGKPLPTEPYRGVCSPGDLSWGPMVCTVCDNTWSQHKPESFPSVSGAYELVSMSCPKMPVPPPSPSLDTEKKQPTPDTLHGELGRRGVTLHPGGGPEPRFIVAQIRATGETSYECRIQWWRHDGTNNLNEMNLNLSKPMCRWLTKAVKGPGDYRSLTGSGARYYPCRVRPMEKKGWVRVQMPAFGSPFSNRAYGVVLIVKAPMVYHEVVKQLAERNGE